LDNASDNEMLGLRLLDRGPDHLLSWAIPRLAKGESVRFVEELVRARRCRYALEPIRAVSGYPFGLVERSALLGQGEDLVVLPRLGRIHAGNLRRFLSEATGGQGRQRRHPRLQPVLAAEFHGIRPYQHGDSPRWIHWRTSARRGELMVREFE